MSILHIVVFKFDPEKFAAEFPGDALQEGIQAMRAANIPGLVEVHMGPKNTTPWKGYQDATQGYTHALVSRSTNAQTLQLYAEHPVHKALQARLLKCLAAPPVRMEVDVQGPKL